MPTQDLWSAWGQIYHAGGQDHGALQHQMVQWRAEGKQEAKVYTMEYIDWKEAKHFAASITWLIIFKRPSLHLMSFNVKVFPDSCPNVTEWSSRTWLTAFMTLPDVTEWLSWMWLTAFLTLPDVTDCFPNPSRCDWVTLLDMTDCLPNHSRWDWLLS